MTAPNVPPRIARLRPPELARVMAAEAPGSILWEDAWLADAILRERIVPAPRHHLPPWVQVEPGYFERREAGGCVA